ncbi:zinc-dependent metalloprotease [uncultured Ferrimonas sp.]|uniref:zinc-dependent metalloprotease n=1 Tax=uncultured Ferrimonas sp. TaxID=432640 RepID=UPI002624C97E|nr:zinc-dependent metalloprotease [uncultured Ferrimonas sp.]
MLARMLIAATLLFSTALAAAPLLPWQVDNSGKLQGPLPPLQQPMLWVSALPHGVGANDIGLDRGQLGARKLVQFERHGDRLLLRQLNTQFRGSSSNAAEQEAIRTAFADAVLWIGTIDNNQVDYSALVLSDGHGISTRLSQAKQGSFTLDSARSLLLSNSAKSFERNSDVDVQLTFSSPKPGPQVQAVAADPNHVSVRLRYSLVALPDEPMSPRRFHPQSGYFPISHLDYTQPLNRPMAQRLLPKHRLQKTDPSALSSPVVKPIVYYLDNATPEPYRSALLEGGNWWTQAFAAAGFEDAFRVELLPDGADPQDIQLNIIHWVHRSTRGWSYGDALIDPRSGEIIKGHVSLGSLRVRQDAKIFRALSAGWADRSAALNLSQQLALARLKQLAAHEIGHTLGLAHNFAASASGDKSVMDYPHPNIGLRDGQITLADSYQHGVSEWDKFAIRFGYSEQSFAELVAEAQQRGLVFISDPDARGAEAAQPQASLWDNGTDPVARLEQLLQIRQLALGQLGPQALLPGQPPSELTELMVPLYLLHRYQVAAVAKVLGGVEYDYLSGRRSHAAPEWQQAALTALLAALQPEQLTVPEALWQQWLPANYGSDANREYFSGRQGAVPDLQGLAEVGAQVVLQQLLNPQRLNRLAEQRWLDGEQLGATELLQQLSEQVLHDDHRDGQEGAQQARLRTVLIDHYLKLYRHADLSPEVAATLRLRLQQDAEKLQRRARRAGVPLSAQLSQLGQAALAGLEDENVVLIHKPLPLPPGSPI